MVAKSKSMPNPEFMKPMNISEKLAVAEIAGWHTENLGRAGISFEPQQISRR